MKKLILIFLAAIAFSCGDGNRSSESGADTRTQDNYSSDPYEADTTDMRMDTTSTPTMDRGDGADTTANNYNNP